MLSINLYAHDRYMGSFTCMCLWKENSLKWYTKGRGDTRDVRGWGVMREANLFFAYFGNMQSYKIVNVIIFNRNQISIGGLFKKLYVTMFIEILFIIAKRK
jgi:hypothetical protein